MFNIALAVEYNGAHYHGWQTQKNSKSVQETLERAISRVANHPVNTICAGRTDAGVHACGQIVAFNTESHRSTRAWVFGINSNLPPDIKVHWACEVADDFNPRFSATARRYRYFIYNNPIRPALLKKQVTWQCRPLQVDLMQEAANYLIGEHDFTSFRAAQCQAKTAIRTIEYITLGQTGDLIVLDIKANAFLHHMVRNIVGTLSFVGTGEMPAIWLKKVLAEKNRAKAGITAPPNGLYLVEVQYPKRYNLPLMPQGPWFFNI